MFLSVTVQREMETAFLACHRTEVYSCWSTASGARVNNYGARIDLILLAEPHSFRQSHLAQSYSSHPPHLAELHGFNQQQRSSQSGSSGTGANISSAASLLQQCTGSDVWMDAQGSDHAPVWADFDLIKPLPTPETAPLLSSRYNFTGKFAQT